MVQNDKEQQKREEIFQISKNLEKIVLIEFFPRSSIKSLNEYCKKIYGKDLINIDERFSKNPPESSIGMIDISDSSIPEDIEKIFLFGLYNFGDFVELIFYGHIKDDLRNYLDEIPTSDRYILIIQKQKEIENWIPREFHGFFFNNELDFIPTDTKLLSIYVYDISKFQNKVFGGGSLDHTTARSNAEVFITEFTMGDDSDSLLLRIQVFSTMLGLVGKDMIILLGKRVLKYGSGSIFSNYVIFSFLKNEVIPNNSLSTFVETLSSILHFNIVLIKIKYELDLLQIPAMSDELEIAKLKLLKRKGLEIEAKINSHNSALTVYCDTLTAHLLEENKEVFENEELWVSSLSGGKNRKSISEFFGDMTKSSKNSINPLFQNKKEEVRTLLERVINEISLKSEEPEVNSMLSSIGEDLTLQIKKWTNKIFKNEIEGWLLNFDTKEDMITALKILDRVTYISHQDFTLLIKALYKKIKYEIDRVPKSTYLYSHIGDITGGSASILKLFQEENGISEDLFIPNSELSTSRCDILILIDDFIGFGSIFVKWYKKNKEKLIGFKKIFYCSIIGFDEGIKRIGEKNISVLCGTTLSKRYKVIDGDIFKSEEKIQIKDLMKKYSDRLPRDYIWGKDNCQLLIMFESNVPNNSLAILWASEYWMPLKERK